MKNVLSHGKFLVSFVCEFGYIISGHLSFLKKKQTKNDIKKQRIKSTNWASVVWKNMKKYPDLKLSSSNKTNV